MDQVSPQYRQKCQQQVFAEVTDENTVLCQLKKYFIDSHLRGNPKKRKEMGDQAFSGLLESQAFHKLVGRLEIVLSKPEDVFIQQEDPADKVAEHLIAEDDGKNDEPVSEVRMYFIAKGKYDVYVKKNHIVSVNKYSEY